MAKQIHFQDVGFQIKKQTIFEHFSFDFKEGENVCMIGQNGVGKTSLLRLLSENVSYQGDILKEGVCRVLLTNTLSSSVSIEEYLNYNKLSLEDCQMVLRYLKLKNISYSISKLNRVFQLKVLLLKQILMHPQFLFLDDILNVFSLDDKKELIQLLNSQKVTLFYVTSNMEDVLLFPYLVVMGKEGVLMEGATLLVLEEEKIMKRLGFSLPFLVDLSLQLKSYGLIDRVYTNERELMNALWK